MMFLDFSFSFFPCKFCFFREDGQGYNQEFFYFCTAEIAAGLVLFNFVFKAVGNVQRKCNIVACVGKPNLHMPTKNT